jgi:hypothetical protein
MIQEALQSGNDALIREVLDSEIKRGKPPWNDVTAHPE